MYKPEFPYKDNQLILSSDRITLLSKTDSIFLFGTQAVSLSSKKTINLDALDKIIIDAPRIELGVGATEPVILGDTFSIQLQTFLQFIIEAGDNLKNVSANNAGTFVNINFAGGKISGAAKRLLDVIKSKAALSQKTFTV